jgi:hypothetical protein
MQHPVQLIAMPMALKNNKEQAKKQEAHLADSANSG